MKKGWGAVKRAREACLNRFSKIRRTPTKALANELIQIRLQIGRVKQGTSHILSKKQLKRQNVLWDEILRRHDQAIMKGKEHLLWPEAIRRIPKKKL